MQIFFDNIVFSIQKAGGVTTYWYELLSGICKSGQNVRFLNARSQSENIYEKRIDYKQQHCIKESWIPDKYLRYLPLRYQLPPASIFHGGYLRVSNQKDILNIITVHDFAHERKLATKFPRVLANTMQKAYSIRRADGIICISDSTKDELLHFFPDIDPMKIRVIHHGISDDFYLLDKGSKNNFSLQFDLNKKYILFVGARRRYKNFSIALNTMQLLPTSYELVIIGGEKWEQSELNDLEQKISGRYHIFPCVSQHDLNILYNNAYCLLYPSVYEGFGFPPGEAMKAGCAVVTTNSTSIPEIVGDAGLKTKYADAMLFAQNIRSLEDEALKQALITKGLQRVQQFTWSKTVQETITFYLDCWNYKFSK